MAPKKAASRSPRQSGKVEFIQKHEPQPHWTHYATRLAAIAGAAGAAVYLFGLARPILDSGPAPFPARAEVEAVAETVKQIRASDAEIHTRLIGQLDAQAARQRAEDAETGANRLRNLQNSIATARAIYDRDKSPENSRVIETLQMQLDALQEQIRKAPPD